MNATSITLEITTVVSVITTVVGLLTFWFKMDKKVSLLEQELNSRIEKQQLEIVHLKNQDTTTHKRIDGLKTEMVKNTDSLSSKFDTIYQEVHKLKLEIGENKTEILTAIAKIKHR